MARPELVAAIAAVRAAAVLTRRVQDGLGPDALHKADDSPVTVADFGAQALVCATLGRFAPGDAVVGEEVAADLSGAAQTEFRRAVVQRVSEALGHGVDEAEVLAWIDRGRGEAGARFWTVDPVDGTKGFVRGEHYAIALALVEDGRPTVAALGCPRLHMKGTQTQGALFVAEAGQGARVLSLFGSEGQGEAVAVSRATDPAALRFVESVESGHSDHNWSSKIAAELGMTREPVRLDSQAKYAIVARGEADIYLRLPTRRDYVEKIWDHAAGALVVTEAGGRVSDVQGKPLDFSRGKTLAGNRGVVASNPEIHDRMLEILGRMRDEAIARGD